MGLKQLNPCNYATCTCHEAWFTSQLLVSYMLYTSTFHYQVKGRVLAWSVSGEW